MSQPRRVVIIAGTHAEAEDYRHRTGLSSRECIYAGETSLRGVGWITSVARTGTWHERRDLAQIEADIAIIQAAGWCHPPESAGGTCEVTTE